jgi:spoIIIJ-associated protein
VPTQPVNRRPVLSGPGSAKAQLGAGILRDLIGLLRFDIVPNLVQDDAEEIHFDLRGKDEARIIGDKGEVLLALQFLLNRFASRKTEDEAVLVLDAAAYRDRRREALADLARRLAQRALSEKKAVRLSPMSAHDRRVFHMTLKDMGVDTRSEGEGLFRQLLIIPNASTGS